MASSRTRTTWWNLVFHYVSIGVTLISGMLLVPLYLSRIPVTIYGYWMATGNILGWLSLADPGFSSLIQQRVAMSYGAGDRSRVGAYLATAGILALALAVLVGLAGIVAGVSLHAILGVGNIGGWNGLVAAFAWAVAGTALSVASFSLTAGALGLQGSLGPGLIYTATQLAALGLTVWWLDRGWGILALGLANFIRGFGLFIGSAGYVGWRVWREHIVCKISRSAFRELLGLSGFTFLAKIPNTLVLQMDTFVAARFLGPKAAIMLGLTQRGYDLARLIAERPALALMPAISHLTGEGDIGRLKATLVRLLRLTLWVASLLVAGFLALNHDFVRLWVGAQFFAGPLVNGLFAAGMGLAVIIMTCANLGFALGDVRGNSMAFIAMSLLTIGLLWVGARFGGLAGIAAAPLLGSLSIGAIYFPRALAQRLHATRADWSAFGRDVLLALGLAVICALAVSRLEPRGWLGFAALVTACVLFFAFGVVILSPAGRGEGTAVLRRFGLCDRPPSKSLTS